MLQKEHFPAFEELHGDNQSKIFGNKLSEKGKKNKQIFNLYFIYYIKTNVFSIVKTFPYRSVCLLVLIKKRQTRFSIETSENSLLFLFENKSIVNFLHFEK